MSRIFSKMRSLRLPRRDEWTSSPRGRKISVFRQKNRPSFSSIEHWENSAPTRVVEASPASLPLIRLDQTIRGEPKAANKLLRNEMLFCRSHREWLLAPPRFEMTAHSTDSTLTDSGSAIPMRRSDPSSRNVKAAALGIRKPLEYLPDSSVLARRPSDGLLLWR